MSACATYLVWGLMVLAVPAASSSDETKFIPKNYSGSHFSKKSYQPEQYAPAQSLRDKEFSKDPPGKGFWSFFKSSRSAPQKAITNQKKVQVKRFKHPENSTASAKHFDKKKPVENESFKSTADARSDKEFVPDNRIRPKNPLLKPSQGIKAPLQ